MGLGDVDALMHFRLAPLHTRRDIALLGVIHRSAIGQGPPQLQKLFPRRRQTAIGAMHHEFQIMDMSSSYNQEYMRRSAFGYVEVYNKLAPELVAYSNVKLFQQGLQIKLCDYVEHDTCWQNMFRPAFESETYHSDI